MDWAVRRRPPARLPGPAALLLVQHEIGLARDFSPGPALSCFVLGAVVNLEAHGEALRVIFFCNN
jgi:hypothetical protein